MPVTRPPYKTSELRQLASQAGAHSSRVHPAHAPEGALAAAAVHRQLSEQVGQLDLGLIGNLRALVHQRSEDSRMQRRLTTARAEKATELMLEKINGEVEILRTTFRADFSDRISALAEAAASSQINVMRKLRALEMEARKLVHIDLKHELDELQEMHRQDVLDDQSFQQEVAYRFTRYEQLKSDFTRTMDEYQATVQNTYQSSSR